MSPPAAVPGPPTPAGPTLRVGWALMGKERGGFTDYVVLRSNEAYFSRSAYQTILHRYSPGTPPHAQRTSLPGSLPWVTVSYAPLGRDTGQTVLGIAERTWSDEADASGRPIAHTRYLCVPFSALAAAPVSYTGLHTALASPTIQRPMLQHSATGTQPAVPGTAVGSLPVTVPRLDPARIAESLATDDEQWFLLAAEAAALVLAGRVAILGFPAPSRDEPTARARLRFLDAVAALLPYGQRARLTASTWAVSGAAHRIRLAFTDQPRQGDLVLRWRDPRPRPAQLPGPAADYFDLLLRLRDQAGGSLAALVAHLTGYPTAYPAAWHRLRATARAYFHLHEMGGGDTADALAALVARRLAPGRLLPDTAPTDAEQWQAVQEKAVEEVAELVRAAWDDERPRDDDAARTFSRRLLAVVAQVPRDDLALELIRLAVLDDLGLDGAPNTGTGTAMDARTAGERQATASTRRWLRWLEGAPELADQTRPFRAVLDGSPNPDVVETLHGRARYLLSLSQLARLRGTGAAMVVLLDPWLWQTVPALSPRHRQDWATEIRGFRFGTPSRAARYDLLLLILGEAPGRPLGRRISTMATDYTAAFQEHFATLVREQGADGRADGRVDQALTALARSILDTGWPQDEAQVDLMLRVLEQLVRLVQANIDQRDRPPGLAVMIKVVGRFLIRNPWARNLPAGRQWRIWLPKI
ncbi:hypothetical protein CcI49_12150 [Frankia sp. CcI49]|nr:hypothetical protein CcI49_12150 [Frankia sp. CcI49]